jgi:hypothetical protein
MSISEISKKLGVGDSGVRYLLQREGLDTGLNRFSKKINPEEIKSRYLILNQDGLKKMKIYEKLSEEFCLSIGHISKKVYI